MYKIENVPLGYKLTFEDFIQKDEMERWVADSKKALNGKSGKFGVFVDMRNLKPLLPDVQAVMTEGQKQYKMAGMERSVVIVQNALTRNQFQRLAKESGIYQWERYVDAGSVSNWERVGKDWVSLGKDPDL